MNYTIEDLHNGHYHGNKKNTGYRIKTQKTGLVLKVNLKLAKRPGFFPATFFRLTLKRVSYWSWNLLPDLSAHLITGSCLSMLNSTVTSSGGSGCSPAGAGS